MGDLTSIGYNGQPVRPPFRPVRPPLAVLVDLTVLFPREPHRTGRYHPHGLQMQKVVEGMLSCWGLCEQGDWWGLVTYEIAYGSKRKTVTHWVPAWTLKRSERQGNQGRGATMRGGSREKERRNQDRGATMRGGSREEERRNQDRGATMRGGSREEERRNQDRA